MSRNRCLFAPCNGKDSDIKTTGPKGIATLLHQSEELGDTTTQLIYIHIKACLQTQIWFLSWQTWQTAVSLTSCPVWLCKQLSVLWSHMWTQRSKKTLADGIPLNSTKQSKDQVFQPSKMSSCQNVMSAKMNGPRWCSLHDTLSNIIASKGSDSATVLCHKSCYSSYTSTSRHAYKRKSDSCPDKPGKRLFRSQVAQFDYANNCLFCGLICEPRDLKKTWQMGSR